MFKYQSRVNITGDSSVAAKIVNTAIASHNKHPGIGVGKLWFVGMSLLPHPNHHILSQLISHKFSTRFTGQAVGAADINGDGFSDLIVGSPWGDNLAEQGGEVAVIWGKAYYSDNNTSFSGTAAAENLVGTSGDDVLVSGGGADAIFSGSGDDVIQIVDTDFYKINGGLGADTLAIMPGAVSLDLSALAPLTVGGIEVIDLGDNGSSLMLSERALLAMSIEGRSLYVDGGSSDGVSLAATDSWVSAGVETVGGVDYVRYESGGAVLYVESGIVVSIM